MRSLLHLAIVGLIATAAIGTSLLSPVHHGNASGGDLPGPMTAQASTALLSQANAALQASASSLQPSSPPAGSLLLAALSLESARTSGDVEASVQRILDLGVPQVVQVVQPLTVETASTETLLDDSPVLPGFEESLSDQDNTEESATPECRETGSPAYCVYTVVEGDTLSAIAQALGFEGNAAISAAEMLAQSNKPDVTSSDHIEPGQNIRVPREPGILHTVFASETAAQLAEAYGASLEAILSSPYNSAGGDGTLVIGQEVFIPDPSRLPVNEDIEITLDEPTPESSLESTPESTELALEPESEASPEASATEALEEPTPTPTPELELPANVPMLGPLTTPTPTPEPTQTPEAEEEEDDATPTATPRRSTGNYAFIWPVTGPVSSRFGPSHPLGIDIDLYNDPNAEIVAARGGKVVFAGGDACCSYGYYVIIEHENGVSTLYAHLSRIVVSVGQQVRQGQVIGLGGRTGYATGNHLHFEIRVDGNVVDPLKYLP